MGANPRFRTLSDYVAKKANLAVACCACDHRGILDAVKVRRWFFIYRWNETVEVVGIHLYCSVCRGRPGSIRPTPMAPDRPHWMAHEFAWRNLVRRLRR